MLLVRPKRVKTRCEGDDVGTAKKPVKVSNHVPQQSVGYGQMPVPAMPCVRLIIQRSNLWSLKVWPDLLSHCTKKASYDWLTTDLTITPWIVVVADFLSLLPIQFESLLLLSHFLFNNISILFTFHPSLFCIDTVTPLQYRHVPSTFPLFKLNLTTFE